MITLPNMTSILASGKAATLAITVLAADRKTVLLARSFGTLEEIGTTAIYWGPPLVVDDDASGFLRYDTDGDASTVGVVVDVQPFSGVFIELGPPSAMAPAEIAQAVRDVQVASAAPGSLGAAIAAIKGVFK